MMSMKRSQKAKLNKLKKKKKVYEVIDKYCNKKD